MRKTIKNAKKEYWRKFCNSIGRETKIGKIWGMIKRMNGINREYGYPVLTENESVAVTDGEKAEMLVQSFTKVHSSSNISEEGRRGREATLNENEEFLLQEEDADDLINVSFTKAEPNRALKKTKMSSPGKDQICYIMLNHLSESSKDILLELYNKVWEKGKVPRKWKEAVVIPIQKLGKDCKNPGSYRPIALTSNVCKIMERMINERLTYYVENKGYVSKYQSGFRRGRNTMDPALCLEHEIRKAQINRESVVAIFFDLEKAYDMMWKEGLLIKLHKIGIKGPMYRWIKDFLLERSIQVKIGKCYSDKTVIENGIPQGSIVSPLLFSIMINDVFMGLENGMGLSLFADDGAIWKRGRNLKFIMGKIQEAINKIEEWSFKWGFKFSVDKTKTMIFTKKRVVGNLKLKLYNQELERVKEIKFLGLWFDERMTWKVHVQKINDKCKKVLNVMRCLVGNEWGADRTSMKTIYIGLIRSVLDYGCIAFGSAAKTSLRRLDNIQYQALRLCSGAIRTTPTAALQVEMGEMPLELRRTQLSLNYWVNLKGHNADHPTQGILKQCWEKEKKETKSFGWIIEQKAKELEINEINICPTVPLSAVHPWILPDPVVDLTLLDKKNRDKEFILHQQVIQTYIENNYYSCIQIYTDASKNSANNVGISFIVPEFNIKVCKRITDGLSVYTGEMLAILLALQWVEELRPLRAVICSDSSSSLISIQNNKSEGRQDILIEIQQTLYRNQMMGLSIILVWIPAHIGIRGNELADKGAKEATKRNQTDMEVPFSKTEMKTMIKYKLREWWQKQWEKEHTGRWFYSIQRRVGMMRNTGKTRREETIISRLRFGHTRLNGTLFKMGKHNSGRCEFCQEEETIEHVMLHCQKYVVERRKMVFNLKEIKVNYDLRDILQRSTEEKCYRFLIQYLRSTKLLERI